MRQRPDRPVGDVIVEPLAGIDATAQAGERIEDDDQGERREGGRRTLHLCLILRACAATCSSAIRLGQETPHVVVARLGEVPVVKADGVERFGRVDADYPVDDSAKRGARPPRGDRHGSDDRCGFARSQRRRRGAHRRSGRKPVVDDDDGLTGDPWLRTRLAVRAFAAAHFAHLTVDDFLQRFVIDAERSDQLFVDDARSFVGERTHCELFVARYAELAHDVDVERQAQAARHFTPDRNAAARQRQNDCVRVARIAGERLGELPPRIGAVSEELHVYSGTPPSWSMIAFSEPGSLCFFPQLSTGGSGAGEKAFGFCVKSKMSIIEVEVASVVPSEPKPKVCSTNRKMLPVSYSVLEMLAGFAYGEMTTIGTRKPS